MLQAFSSRFQKFLPYILQHEGGYVNHANDPGGETYRGISRKAHPASDLWKIVDQYKRNIPNIYTSEGIARLNDALSKDARVQQIIMDIYHKNYWLAVKADQLPYPIGEYVFDFAVNAGVVRAILTLQKVLGVKVDGLLGPVTIDAANNKPTTNIMQEYYIERVNYYVSITMRNINQFNVFFLGWIRRTNDMYKLLMNK